MNRRSFIAAAAAATTTAVAGCLADGPPATDPDGDATDEPTDEPSASPDPTPGDPRLADTDFEVTDVACGTADSHHDVTTGDGTVTVDGVVDGRNTCYTAELVRGEYVGADDTLYVEVEARERDDPEACAMCLVEIHYTATFAFENGTPDRVEVDQRGATTGSASSSERASGSATPPADEDGTTPDDD